MHSEGETKSMPIHKFSSSACTSANPLSTCTAAVKHNAESVNNTKAVESPWLVRYSSRSIKLTKLTLLRLVYLVSRYLGLIAPQKTPGMASLCNQSSSSETYVEIRKLWTEEKSWNQNVSECVQTGRKVCERPVWSGSI